MHKADLKHDSKALQGKLETIFQLRRTRSKVNWDRRKYLKLLAAFDNPQENLPPVIHVAGTNGKGSIIAMLRSILKAQGLVVHSYTSPHLIHVNERIYLAGKPIDNTYLEELIDQALVYNNGEPLSFFEITTALAFKAFSEVPADILLLEVGMGGRLDCTNVIDEPLATVINRISMDHTDFLGSDIRDIAKEKAGIMKAGVPCIIGYQGEDDHSVIGIINDSAKSVGAPILSYGDDWNIKTCNDHMVFSFNGEEHSFPLPALQGAHQVKNAGVALATLFAIQDHITVTHNTIETGLRAVQWQGRLQHLSSESFGLSKNIDIWLDSGHNDSAAEALAVQIQAWQAQNKKPVHLIMGMLGTKNAGRFLAPLLPYISRLHIVPILSDSSSQTKDDIDQVSEGMEILEHDNFEQAIKDIALNEPSVRVLIAGSVYLAGEVLQYVQNCD